MVWYWCRWRYLISTLVLCWCFYFSAPKAFIKMSSLGEKRKKIYVVTVLLCGSYTRVLLSRKNTEKNKQAKGQTEAGSLVVLWLKTFCPFYRVCRFVVVSSSLCLIYGDEIPFPLPSPDSSCLWNQFACSKNKCIAKQWLCDGENDCEDGLDESVQICGKCPFRCHRESADGVVGHVCNTLCDSSMCFPKRAEKWMDRNETILMRQQMRPQAILMIWAGTQANRFFLWLRPKRHSYFKGQMRCACNEIYNKIKKNPTNKETRIALNVRCLIAYRIQENNCYSQ